MIAMIGTTKAKKTATTSCLGVLMGPSCGPCSAWGGVASLMESSRLREDRCVPDVLWATQNPSIIKGGLWPKADNQCRRRARCDNPRHAPVAQWIEYCPPKAGVAGSIPAGRATPSLHGTLPIPPVPSFRQRLGLDEIAIGRCAYHSRTQQPRRQFHNHQTTHN